MWVMGNSLQFFPWIAFLFLRPCGNQAQGNDTKSQGHPGFQVLKSASHYWPLDLVNGIRELPRATEGRMGPMGNDSDRNIVEGTVNHGIVLNEQKGVTLLYFGSSKNSCISDLSLCGPEGVTFSFFWKIQDLAPRNQPKPINQSNNQESFQDDPSKSQQIQAFGKKVTSHGFQIYSDEREGYVEVYRHGDSKVWNAKIKPPGPYWTHVLFTWTSNEGLKVYVNGTYNASDSQGHVSYSYVTGVDALVVGTNSERSKHYVNGIFDEFIIWERALSPPEIQHYFTDATGMLFWG